MNIRHINRGDIREGGCAMCKPVHKREGSFTLPKDWQPVDVEVQEYLEEMHDDDDWTFDV